MSLTKYTPPSEKEEKRKRCCYGVKMDLLFFTLVFLGMAFCCSSVKDANRLNKQTEKLRNEIEARP